MIHRGFFEGSVPEIDIEVCGASGEPVKVRAAIDTGFNDFLSLPYAVALPLGLALVGVGSGKLADGSETSYLVCKGRVVLGRRGENVLISVEPNGRALIGNNLLAALGLTLRFNPDEDIVELIEN